MNTENNLFSEFSSVSLEEWERVIEDDLKGADYKTRLKWKTGEGIEALPFYRHSDFKTSPQPISTEYSDWEIRQPVVEQNIQKANKIALKAIEGGAGSLSFTVNIRQTEGMPGRDLEGPAIQNQAAFANLFDGIDITATSLHFDCGITLPVLLAMLHNECEKRGINSAAVTGSVLYDPYTFIITNGQLPKEESAFIDENRQIVEFCNEQLPAIKCLGVDGRVYHNAGGTIVQELGYALATGSEYLATLTEAGLNVNDIAPAVHFNFSIASNYFLEIAKFRAARKLWQKVLDAYRVDEHKKAYLHGSSSNWNKTTYDPYMNMLRTTTEGMSAAIAGCNAITLHPFDSTFSQPDDFSRRIARNSQIILKEESYFNKVADPAAGSYYIEILTDKIAEAAWNCFQEVETQGGIFKSIKSGYIQTAIEQSRKQREQAVATRRRVFVGINRYANAGTGKRGETEIEKPTTSLRESDTNVDLDSARRMKSLKKALQNGCTIGDLVPALSDITKHNVRQIQPYRGAKPFEVLREATQNHAFTPKVLTLPLGDKKRRKARSDFAASFLGCAGYEIEEPLGFDSIEEAVSAINREQPDIVVLCSSDEAYEKLVPELTRKLNKLDHEMITVLAGYPKEQIEQYQEMGIDAFIHAKCNVLDSLKDFQKKLGITTN